jgi:hypothetical protein
MNCDPVGKSARSVKVLRENMEPVRQPLSIGPRIGEADRRKNIDKNRQTVE